VDLNDVDQRVPPLTVPNATATAAPASWADVLESVARAHTPLAPVPTVVTV
jgi:hypothetical protein